MKFKNYFLFYMIATLAIMVCKKSQAEGLNSATKTDTDVYIVGHAKAANGNSMAVYWKNGVIHKLSDSTLNCYGQGITIKDSDVYVTGYYQTTTIKAVYWKNGVEIKLTDDAIQSEARAIAVSGDDVYIAGSIYDNVHLFQAVYWKNGKVIILSPGVVSRAYALAVSGNDVYVAGNIPIGGIQSSAYGRNGSRTSFAYWKNGVLANTLDSSTTSSANGIAFNGTDIYTVGYTMISKKHVAHIATYWKNNGKANKLTNESSPSEAEAIAIKGNDLYITGYTIVPDKIATHKIIATYWKNGKGRKLTDNAETEAIALVGDDMYAAGYSYTDGAIYWKNGLMKIIAGGVNATGIAVVTHTHN